VSVETDKMLLELARKDENELIIKLLKKQMADCCSYGPGICFKCEIVDKSIELIKGENK
jgi:hypothetical protein